MTREELQLELHLAGFEFLDALKRGVGKTDTRVLNQLSMFKPDTKEYYMLIESHQRLNELFLALDNAEYYLEKIWTDDGRTSKTND